MELKAHRALGLMIAFLTLTLTVAPPVVAFSGYVYGAGYICIEDQMSDQTWMFLFVGGSIRESDYYVNELSPYYFYTAQHTLHIVDIAPTHTIKNVVFRAITDQYQLTITRSQMYEGQSLSITRGNIISDGIMIILDFDVIAPVYKWIYEWHEGEFRPRRTWVLHHYDTVHVHTNLSIDTNDISQWKPLLLISRWWLLQR